MNLSHKFYGVVGLLLLIMIIVAVYAISTMNHIGTLLVEITEEDIPITAAVTEISVNQLGQAIWLERAIGATGMEDVARMRESEREFGRYAELIDEEIMEARYLIGVALEEARNEESKRKFAQFERNLELVQESHVAFQGHANGLFELLNNGSVGGAARAIENIESEEASLDKQLEEFLTQLENFTQNAALEAEHAEQTATQMLIVLTIVGLLLGMGIGYLLVRMVVGPTRNAAHTMQRIAEGDFSSTIVAKGGDEIAQLNTAMSTMQQKLKEQIEADKLALASTGRIKAALDKVDSSVMLANPNLEIMYLNESAKSMMRKAGDDIRKEVSGFDADNLIGSHIDIFKSNQLTNLDNTFSTEIAVGGRTFKVIANPVVDESGERQGTVVEWADRTQEKAVEREVEDIVDAAKAGDLTQRIQMAGKSGFFGALGQGVNDLVDVCENIINDMLRVLGAMSRGDLTESIQAEYQGSFGRLKANTNATLVKLTAVIGAIKTGAEMVQTGTYEISQGNANLSERTEAQASTLQQTASSMEEMTATVKQNADNAHQASELAESTRAKAEAGGQVVGKAITAMKTINESSEKISNIIGVIDEIAFQTNLLALNAAVEAARAGEQGRGFAVVASEVRSLAGRSATAAKEIKTLISDSVSNVNEGTKLVNESGQTLEEIVKGVQEVSEIVAAIAAASQQQAAGIQEVNNAIAGMDEATQQNAAMVEEASAAAQSIGEQATNLSQEAGFFNLVTSAGGGSGGSGTTISSPPPLKRPQAIVTPNADVEDAGDEGWEEF